MDELVQWLGEQLDEDERIARAATPGPWTQSGIGEYGWGVSFSRPGAGVEAEDSEQGRADAEHIAAHDPARVLREIDAKRRILAECAYWHGKLAKEAADPSPVPFPTLGEVLDAVTPILRALALPYADRPGYQEGWRP
ncbi:DUF6221 family protein [Streptomyces europaeiscabiei]|uniref:DUF6221 family protein n=1 Tax=Streptomyces europaeiscabiei TaxID=146819 RepID=UPI0029A83007|nr:DUF6221 family protein [Streptomyces europaeiscabiei]MDX3549527.1 DUF6221 family protein [Streptomyces europaeiscabiei]